MNYQSDIESLAERVRVAVDDDWPDLIDEGSAKISQEYEVDIDTVLFDLQVAL